MTDWEKAGSRARVSTRRASSPRNGTNAVRSRDGLAFLPRTASPRTRRSSSTSTQGRYKGYITSSTPPSSSGGASRDALRIHRIPGSTRSFFDEFARYADSASSTSNARANREIRRARRLRCVRDPSPRDLRPRLSGSLAARAPGRRGTSAAPRVIAHGVDGLCVRQRATMSRARSSGCSTTPSCVRGWGAQVGKAREKWDGTSSSPLEEAYARALAHATRRRRGARLDFDDAMRVVMRRSSFPRSGVRGAGARPGPSARESTTT